MENKENIKTIQSNTSTKFIVGMRESYFEELYKIFQKDKNAVILVADNGSQKLDEFAINMPDQYFQVGIAEQALLGIAAGLSVEGKKTYGYAIAPFVTIRIAEFIKLDQCAMNTNMTLLGVGHGFSYVAMGPTHHCVEWCSQLNAMPNLTIWQPSDANMAAQLAHYSHTINGPQYIGFDRAGVPDLYNNQILDLSKGLFETRSAKIESSKRITIVTSGRFVYESIKIADILESQGIATQVIDVFRIKPFNIDELLKITTGKIVTYEEHYLNGGLGSIVLDKLNDNENYDKLPILKIGVDDKFTFEYGQRLDVWEDNKIDPNTAIEKIKNWVK